VVAATMRHVLCLIFAVVFVARGELPRATIFIVLALGSYLLALGPLLHGRRRTHYAGGNAALGDPANEASPTRPAVPAPIGVGAASTRTASCCTSRRRRRSSARLPRLG
jgi:hypothetical protein